MVADHARCPRTPGFRGHGDDDVAILQVLDLDVLDHEDVRQQRIKGGTRVDVDVARVDHNLGGHFDRDEDAPCSRHYRMFPTADRAVGDAVSETDAKRKRKPSAPPMSHFWIFEICIFLANIYF